jgi:hypothetical protein
LTPDRPVFPGKGRHPAGKGKTVMRKLGWTLLAIVAVVVAATMHYCLPQRDIVRIVGTQMKLMESGTDPATGSGESLRRDVRFISAEAANGQARTYRNEDTGFGWPPCFKFDSADLTAEAQALADSDDWVAVRHYGWRIQMLDMFPNLLGLRPVAGPDVRLIPWFNIVFVAGLVAMGLYLRRWWSWRFGSRRRGRA